MRSLSELEWALDYAYGRGYRTGKIIEEKIKYDRIMSSLGSYKETWSGDIIILEKKIKEHKERLDKIKEILE